MGVFQELCERHEKGVLSDHQRALQKMGQYKKKKMSAQIKDTVEVSGFLLTFKIPCTVIPSIFQVIS